MSPSRAHRAFTLIELLVVVSIIAVLAAMLLPAIKLVRASALGIRCGNNLGQINIASGVYSEDWNGMLVPSYTGSISWKFWYDLLADGLDEASTISTPTRGRILRGCPGWLPSVSFSSLPLGGWQWQQYSGYCETLQLAPLPASRPLTQDCTVYDTTWWANYLDNPVSRITKRSTRPFIFDTSRSAFGDNFGWGMTAQAVSDIQRHAGKANVLFFDGHIGHHTKVEIGVGQNLPR